ncbi:MAG: hypothetical protein ACYTG4_07700 [Planctomycetota bacterium]
MEITPQTFRLPPGWPRWQSLATVASAFTAVALLAFGPAILRISGGCGFYYLTGAPCPG